MRKYFVNQLITALLLIFIPLNAFAQKELKADNFIRAGVMDLSIVTGMGLGGAVLGLSTLSFVDRPKDHLKNILVGGSIGIILGVIIAAYGQATRSRNIYYDDGRFPYESVQNQTFIQERPTLAHAIFDEGKIKVTPTFFYSLRF